MGELIAKTFEEYVEICQREYVGRVIPDRPLEVEARADVAYKLLITRFCNAMGDDNPLFRDAIYAAKTRYGCILAPPTFVVAHRYPGTPRIGRLTGFPIRSFYAGAEIEWNDVIRVNTRLRSERTCTDIVKKRGRRTGDFAILYAESPVYNQHDELLCKVKGWSIKTRKVTDKYDVTKGDLIFKRDIHKYTQEERNKIVQAIKSEVRRGSKPRYWEDVNVGDELTPVVKGPLTMAELIQADGATDGRGSSFELLYHRDVNDPHAGVHPVTGWVSGSHWDHYDFIVCRNSGLPLPFDLGNMRTALSYHIISNWMGDDGFLRKLKVEMREFFYYSDTLWYSAQVVKKEKTEEGHAVEINFKAVNQLGETVTPGKATVLLPTRTEEVHLPIKA